MDHPSDPHAQVESERRDVRELGLPDDDEGPLTEEYRQIIRRKIDEGLADARQGNLVDGEAFFTRLYAELDDIERQSQE
jgi:hypothetical protein